MGFELDSSVSTHAYMSIDIYQVVATKPCLYVSNSVVSLILPDLFNTIAYKQKLQNVKIVKNFRILHAVGQQLKSSTRINSGY